jgi:hypothetical protein
MVDDASRKGAVGNINSFAVCDFLEQEGFKFFRVAHRDETHGFFHGGAKRNILGLRSMPTPRRMILPRSSGCKNMDKYVPLLFDGYRTIRRLLSYDVLVWDSFLLRMWRATLSPLLLNASLLGTIGNSGCGLDYLLWE